MTGGGENVAPFVKIISHAMLVGDQRKHLAVVITLKMVLNKQNQPTDNLHPDVTEWL